MSPLYVRKVLTRLTFLNQNTPRLGCFPAAWLQGLFYNVRLQGEPLRRFHSGWDRLGKADSVISTGIKLRFGQNGGLDRWFCMWSVCSVFIGTHGAPGAHETRSCPLGPRASGRQAGMCTWVWMGRHRCPSTPSSVLRLEALVSCPCPEQASSPGGRPVYENESALNLYETCKVRTVKAGTLEKLVEHLVPAFQGSDLSYVTIFLCTYRAFTTTQRVLDLLFQRYGCILPYSSEDGGPQDQLKNAVSSILRTWLDQYSEDFCQPPDFPCLKQLVAYVQLNMPGSDLERRAHLLLAQLERTELTKAEPEGEERGWCWTRRSPRGCLGPPTWGPLAGRRPVSDPGWSLCKRPRAVSFACKGTCVGQARGSPPAPSLPSQDLELAPAPAPVQSEDLDPAAEAATELKPDPELEAFPSVAGGTP
ncbi:ral guanine nucleotide dissociation stimulator-like [Pseudorca crassidens]|uniref:ral guanine nucleotide dissociation stimulator-like n=1 Tax=Pseudorca crassidens TaxID=82174 RepID=UPI00352FAA89